MRHLNPIQIDRYLEGDLDDATLNAVDQHLGICLPCVHELARRDLAQGRWERRGPLGRLVRVEEPEPVSVRREAAA